MILAAAQTKPVRYNIEANLADHLRLVQLAADKGAELIVFPEMSITGYEREKAADLAFVENDDRLDALRKLADDNKIIIIAGAPIRTSTGFYIAEFVIRPKQPVVIYTKQFLHTGEDDCFQSSFDYNPILQLGKEKVALAICADIDNPLHPENAHRIGSTLYVPSIFFSPNGIPEAHRLLSGYAKKHTMNVLMANFGGDTWGQPSGGRSAFWNNKGELVAEMKNSGSGLLLVENKNDNWIGQIVEDK